ncbi:hypothetical protein B0T20DRAFT_246291 [Sordaria brevicollis]|uniref:Rhodopsin domain-containing protein n=1 Tax=Sordaria brevicollis TaxID=83679 RepID=A0AAE0PBW4_SORBR|nr:hypothetical protein B0T20DRAFT_246291 [Sordaria brevicollis]
MTRLGLGYTFLKAFELFPGDAVTRVKFVPIVTFAAITACWISKLSFFITLIRLVSRWWQKATLWFLMTTSTVCLIVLSFLMSVKECNDFHEFGQLPDRDNCINLRVTRTFGIFASVYATVMDLLLSVVPSFVMWKLKLPRHEKVAIVCAMSTGCL